MAVIIKYSSRKRSEINSKDPLRLPQDRGSYGTSTRREQAGLTAPTKIGEQPYQPQRVEGIRQKDTPRLPF